MPPISRSKVWHGRLITVDVLYTQAAVATQILITSKSDDTSVLFDAGDGVLRDLMFKKFDFQKLTSIVFTHGHYDHSAGLFALLSFLRIVCNRRQVLDIYLPQYCLEVEEQVNLWKKIFGNRSLYQLNLKTLNQSVTFKISDFSITAKEAAHPSSQNTSNVINGIVKVPDSGQRGFYYIVETTQERIVVCLDSGPSEQLERDIIGADLALIEATASVLGERIQEIHMSTSYAEKIGAKAKSFILVHRGISNNYFKKLQKI